MSTVNFHIESQLCPDHQNASTVKSEATDPSAGPAVDGLPSNVVSLDARRREHQFVARQIRAGRGSLFVNIQDDGAVDYGVDGVSLDDAPAMLMAALMLCMRLTRQIDDAAAMS